MVFRHARFPRKQQPGDQYPAGRRRAHRRERDDHRAARAALLDGPGAFQRGPGARLQRHCRRQRHPAPGNRRAEDPVLQRVREPLRADRGRQQGGRALPRDAGALALVPDPHRRLPHLPEPERARHHQKSLSRPRIYGLPGPAEQQLRPVGELRTVPGDGLQLREPAHGARGHLLLLRARERQTRPRAGGQRERPHDLSRLRDHQLPHGARRGGGQRGHHPLDARTGGAARGVFAQRLQLREAQDQPARQEPDQHAQRAERL